MNVRCPGILAIWNDCAAGTEREYEHWYRSEHLAERVGIEGFVSGWRYVAVDAQPGYFTHYVTESVDVLFSDAYHERLNDPTPLTRTIMSGIFVNCTRTICERVLRVGDARGAFALVIRFTVAQDVSTLSNYVRSVVEQDAVLRAELWIARAPSSQASFAEFEIRGPDESIAACVVIETTDERDVREVARGMDAQLAGADQIGIYRLMCGLQKSEQRA